MAIYRLRNDERINIQPVKDGGPEMIIRIGNKIYNIRIHGLQTEETVVKTETIERFRKIVERYRDSLERLAQ
jgi:hypothetical protein